MTNPGIAAGSLRHRVILQRDENAGPVNSVGQLKAQYQDVGAYYALVECLGGSEPTNANQQKGLLKYRVTLRTREIRPTDRFSWKGKTLNVVDASTDPFGTMTVANCLERSATQ